MKVRLLITAGKFPVKRQRLGLMTEQVCRRKKLKGLAEVSLSLVDELEIRRLNQQYMGRREVTDVLAFPLGGKKGADGVMRLGDVVICYPQAAKQAGKYRLGVDEELERLLKHGLLHLLGEHHD